MKLKKVFASKMNAKKFIENSMKTPKVFDPKACLDACTCTGNCNS